IRPNAADVAERVARLVQARDLHDVAGVRRVDELAVANVDADVAGAAWSRVEEHQIARSEVVGREDARALAPLRAAVVREVDAELRVDVHHEPRAVEAG